MRKVVLVDVRQLRDPCEYRAKPTNLGPPDLALSMHGGVLRLTVGALVQDIVVRPIRGLWNAECPICQEPTEVVGLLTCARIFACVACMRTVAEEAKEQGITRSVAPGAPLPYDSSSAVASAPDTPIL